MPSIKRRKSAVFMDEPREDNRSICQVCYEDGYTTKLVEYKPDPSHYKVCPFCGNIVDKNVMRYESTTQPLGYRGGIKQQGSYEVVSKKRRIRVRDNSNYEEQEIPKFGNREDTELKQMLEHGILVSISDDLVGDSE